LSPVQLNEDSLCDNSADAQKEDSRDEIKRYPLVILAWASDGEGDVARGVRGFGGQGGGRSRGPGGERDALLGWGSPGTRGP